VSRPLNFLHLTTFYPPYCFGGDAIYLHRLAHALGDEGHQVDVVHCVDAYHLLHPGEPEIVYPTHPNVTAHGLRSGYRWLSPLLTQQTGRPLMKTRRIREIARSKPYDVIHFHNISLLGPKVLEIAREQSRAVTLYTAHEHWLVCPMHVLWKFNRRPCEKPECLRCSIASKRPPQLWRYSGMLDRAAQHVDQFLSPSRFTAETHRARGFPRPFAQLPHFIERVDGDWQTPGPRPHLRPYFLFVGRLETIKGLHTLIDAWEQITEYDLLVAGTGTEEANLRARAAHNPRVRFLGALPQSALGPLYVHALACIVSSITYETFGITIIEAFARKTPVIVRKLGPMPEVVEESGGGIVYDAEEELLAALHRIAHSEHMRTQLGERGYQAFLRRWTKEAHLQQYFNYLRTMAINKLGGVPWDEVCA